MDTSQQPLVEDSSRTVEAAPRVHIPQSSPPPPLPPHLIPPAVDFNTQHLPNTTSPHPPPPLQQPLPMADVAQSPRKTVSSASANARAQQQPQKKPGAPKPKGAVRAKSGCYTCRIRRKKCDEQPNEHGACQTCVRLRLQCLGFGAKRPDWMRENNSVTELREKIKAFLASQGMIKGHSGSGPRSNESEPQILTLVDNLQTQPSSSPPTPTLSSGSNDALRPPQGPVTSYVRDAGSYHHPPPSLPTDQHHPYAPPPSQTTWSNNLPELNAPPHPHPHPHDAASLGRGPLLPNDILYTPQNTILPPTSIVNPLSSSQPPSSSWLSYNGSSASTISYAPSQQPQQSHPQPQQMQVQTQLQSLQPALHSSFSDLYHEAIIYDDSNDDAAQVSPDSVLPVHDAMQIYDPHIPYEQKDLVQHYMSNVLPIQYLLSDSTVIRTFIYDLIRESDSARDAACMLAAIHRHRTGYLTPQGPYQAANGGVVMPAAALLYKRLFESLARKTSFNEGDAMAGLHAVSTILFSGGRGAWDMFLSVASNYVHNVLTNPRYPGPEEVLRTCSESTRFIVKTTMWFDVLASVTTQQVPRFLMVYRQLFDRSRRAFIEDGAHAHAGPPETSMLPVMGCENNIVLAIAEISNLACWKESQAKRNCLSIPKLVERGKDIEDKFLTPGGASSPSAIRGPNGLPPHAGPSTLGGAYGGAGLDPQAPPFAHPAAGGAVYAQSPVYGPPPGMMPLGNGASEVELRRRLTNDIFRASARVYLHTVLSGDYPSCPEIVDAVTEVIECLKRVPLDRALVSRSVLRSVVFGICIAGCLTDSPEQRQFLKRLLDTQSQEKLGNVSEVTHLMEQVWIRRDSEGSMGQAVNWRDVMRESQRELLLLV